MRVTTNHEMSAAGAQRIDIFTEGGDIQVTPGEAGAVHVAADREAPTEAEARALPIELTVVGDVVRIAWHAAPEGDSAVSFRLSVPPGLDLVAHSEGGDIGVHGDDEARALVVETGGGDVRVTHHTGEVRTHSAGGNIHVDGALLGKNVVETEGGDIDVELLQSSQLVVHARTAGGDASNEFGLPVGNDGESVGYHGTIGDGHDGSLELDTAGGDVRLRKGP